VPNGRMLIPPPPHTNLSQPLGLRALGSEVGQ
jgi:hypothetical protein